MIQIRSNSTSTLDFHLNRQITYLKAHSSFYQNKLAKIELPSPNASFKRYWESIPFTNKKELLTLDHLQSNLLGANQCCTTEDIIRVAYSGGTSGQALKIGFTKVDAKNYALMGARALWAAGVRPKHTVINCFNYHLYAGGVMDQMAFEHLGCAVIPFGIGKSAKLLEFLCAFKTPLILYCTPSYGLRLAALAKQQGVDFSKIKLDFGVFSGEAFLQKSHLRNKLESSLQTKAIDFYGIAELGVQSSECPHSTNLHFLSNDLIYSELIDPNSGLPLPLTKGTIGELVFTHIQKQATPLLRFRSFDLVEITESTCDCKLSGFSFKHLSRSDDMIKYNGINIYAEDIQSILFALKDPSLTGNFQAKILDTNQNRKLTIHIESIQVDQSTSLHKNSNLRSIFQKGLGVCVEICFQPLSFFDQTTKITRFKEEKYEHQTMGIQRSLPPSDSSSISA